MQRYKLSDAIEYIWERGEILRGYKHYKKQLASDIGIREKKGQSRHKLYTLKELKILYSTLCLMESNAYKKKIGTWQKRIVRIQGWKEQLSKFIDSISKCPTDTSVKNKGV